MANEKDYLQQAQNLLPQGPVWTRLLNSILSKVLLVFAKMFFQVDKRINELVEESNPSTTLELLPDWEKDIGLPDECVMDITTSKTIKERQRDVVIKLTSNQVLTTNYFLELIKKYGFNVDINEFQPFVCGYSVCGDEIGGNEDVRYNILVVVKDKDKDYRELECLLNKIKQAHTNIIFINKEKKL